MADSISALQGHLKPGRHGRSGAAGVTLCDIAGFTLTQIAGWPETMAGAARQAAKAAGSRTAPRPGKAIAGDHAALLRIEPLKWWLVCEGAGAPPDLSLETCAVLDLSSSRTWLRVAGAEAATLLNHFLPLDLREVSFPAGSVASTAFHHVGVTLWRADDGYNLFLPRSFSASLRELLFESAVQYGLEITTPPGASARI